MLGILPLLSLLSGCLLTYPNERSTPRPCLERGVFAQHEAHPLNNLAFGGKVSDDHLLDLRIHLRPVRDHELDDFLAQLENPSSPHYHRFLTPAEFEVRFGHDAQDEAVTRAYLKSEGFRVGHARGSVLHAQARVGDAERVFGTRIHHVRGEPHLPTFAPIEEPSWSGALGIAHVSGLAAHIKHHTHKRARPHAVMPAAQKALRPSAIRGAYNIPDAATGVGQTLALIELDGYDPADLKKYAQTMHIRQVPVKNVLVSGCDGKVHDQDARVEVTMDIELAMAMAPGLDEIRVFEANNDAHGMTDILNELANPTTPDKQLIKWIGLSWGAPERSMYASDAAIENRLIKQLAAQGQTLMVASGDDGAADDGQHLGTDDPASQPYAVAVGGTTLRVRNDAWLSETTWAGGGGGISCFWKAPSWQHDMLPAAKGSAKMRNVPDVALNADPETGYLVYVNGWQTVGGTSCAAPLWAAFGTLIDERRAQNNKGPLGFFSPTLYSVAVANVGKPGFHDVADLSTNGYYPAVPGRDDATGWGTINGAPLLDLFAQ